MPSRPQRLVELSRALADEVDLLRFSAPVAYVYNPLRYARRAHEAYLERVARGTKQVVLLGMNPGPYGMVQTGVPFGDVATVRDWLRIDAPIEKPAIEHPKRPVLGLGCPRIEVSGTRLWGWARARYASPADFFARFYVANYCPLAFLEAGGRNRTPDKLLPPERARLQAACDRALRELTAVIEPSLVVGIGSYARVAAARALEPLGLPVAQVLHPSPANPQANRGWAEQAEQALQALGVRL